MLEIHCHSKRTCRWFIIMLTVKTLLFDFSVMCVGVKQYFKLALDM